MPDRHARLRGLVEMAEAKLHGETVSLEELRRILRPWLRMQEPPDTVVLGCTHFPLLQEELLKVLPEGTRLVDSGAAIARRTAAAGTRGAGCEIR